MIHTGDCLEVMAGMPADSVDAVVTDPPYGIGFMGKSWDAFDQNAVEVSWSGRGRNTGSKRNPDADTPGGRSTERTGFRDTNPRCGTCGRVTRGRDTAKGYKVCHCVTPVIVGTPNRDAQRFQAWTLGWAREAFRVTKPGGYLLAFGGTRTHHRLVCGLEDAGWVIRDELQWNYLQGFPKGRANLKPAQEPIVLARKPGPLRHLNIEENRIPVTGPTTTMDAWEPDANLCASCAADAASQERRGAGVTRASTTPRRAEVWPSEPDGSVATGDSPATSASRGSERTGRSSTSSSTARSGRTLTAPSQRDTSSTTSTGRRLTTASRTCPSCGATSTATTTTETGISTPSDQLEPSTNVEVNSGGRWPSNVLVLAEDTAFYDEASPYVVGSGAGDEGIGVSRVFIVPKADRADREPIVRGSLLQQHAGVGIRQAEPGEYEEFVHPAPDGIGAWLKEHREAAGLSAKALCAAIGAHGAVNHGGAVSNWEQELNRPTPDQWRKLREVLGFDDRYDEVMTTVRMADRQLMDGALPARRENAHPTVKPTDLMRHLIRLVTPSGGTVLDPFLGSGSTAIACEMEGFPWVGIEQDPSYVAIAEARLNGTQRGLGLDVGAPTRKRGPQDSLEKIRASGRQTHPVNNPAAESKSATLYELGFRKPDEEPAA